jgi:hypothetical protein
VPGRPNNARVKVHPAAVSFHDLESRAMAHPDPNLIEDIPGGSMD